MVDELGLLWKPTSDDAPSWGDFTAARSELAALLALSRWSPWKADEVAARVHALEAILDQWSRAEPGHRYLTADEWQARLDTSAREAQAVRAASRLRQERAARSYDAAREKQRLHYLEESELLARATAEIEEFRSGGRYPKMAVQQREAKLEGLIRRSDELGRSLAERLTQIGDPETVVDRHGWTPHDRRHALLDLFEIRRKSRIKQLQDTLPAAPGAEARHPIRDALRRIHARELRRLLDLPPLGPEDMCSECATPVLWHSGSDPVQCPAWPDWHDRIAAVRAMLSAPSASDRVVPKVGPLAVVKGGLATGELLERLLGLDAEFPQSVVRAGRGGRLELWPATPEDGAPS